MRRYELCVGSPSVAASPNEKNTNVFTSRHAGVGAGGEISSSGYNSKKEFCLRRMACFGSPKYDRKEPLHILSADSRFPDVAPGRQVASGNHFLALFPYSSCD